MSNKELNEIANFIGIIHFKFKIITKNDERILDIRETKFNTDKIGIYKGKLIKEVFYGEGN
jgi:hypothetical protein